MPFICEIGGVDYSDYLKDLDIAPGGDGLVGEGTLYLDEVAGGLTIVPMMDVKVWQTFNSAGDGIAPKGRLFGGHINHRTTGNFGNTKTWEINCWDYNVILDKLVRDIWWAGSSTPIVLTAGHFNAQIASLFDQLQKNGGASPPVLIDVSTGVVDFVTSMPAVTYAGGHKASWYVQQLCNTAQTIDTAIRPHFYMGYGNTFGALDIFGSPVLWIYDGALTPPTVADFSDTPTGSEVPYYGTFKRVDDSSVLTQRIQSIYNDGVLTSYDPTSQGTYPNKYINHGAAPGGIGGYWMDEAIKDQGSNSSPEAQAALDRLIATKANPKETFTFDTYERIMPGDYVSLTNSLEGISAQTYRVAQVKMTLEPPDVILSKLTVGNRRLLLFDNGEEEVAGIPIEGDHIPPLAPASLAITSDTWNRNTGQADMVFLIGASPSPDAAGYIISGTINGSTLYSEDVGANLTPLLSFAPDITYSLQAVAYDRAGNLSPFTPVTPLTGVTASPVPDPPTALAVFTAWTWGINGYLYDGLGHAQVALLVDPPAELPEHYIFQGYLDTDLVFETRWPGSSTVVVSPVLNIGDTYTYKLWSEVHDVRSTTSADLGPLIVPPMPADHVQNPGFEFVNAGAAVAAIRNWTATETNGGTVTQDSSNPHTGTFAAKLTTTGTSGSLAKVTSDPVLVRAARYVLQFYAKSPTSAPVGRSIAWFQNDGTPISTLGISPLTTTTTYPLGPYTITVPTPSGAGYFKVLFTNNTLSSTVYVDDVSCEPQLVGEALLDSGIAGINFAALVKWAND